MSNGENGNHKRCGTCFSGHSLKQIPIPTTDVAARSEALRHLTTVSLHSAQAAWMLDQLSGAELSVVEKKQMARKLLVAGMIENNGNTQFSENLMYQVSPEIQQYMQQVLAQEKGAGR